MARLIFTIFRWLPHARRRHQPLSYCLTGSPSGTDLKLDCAPQSGTLTERRERCPFEAVRLQVRMMRCAVAAYQFRGTRPRVRAAPPRRRRDAQHSAPHIGHDRTNPMQLKSSCRPPGRTDYKLSGKIVDPDWHARHAWHQRSPPVWDRPFPQGELDRSLAAHRNIDERGASPLAPAGTDLSQSFRFTGAADNPPSCPRTTRKSGRGEHRFLARKAHQIGSPQVMVKRL